MDNNADTLSADEIHNKAIANLFNPLWKDIQEKDQYFNAQPLLAHYTSIEVFESILKNKEFWFSNPLYMNDVAEVKYVINTAIPLIQFNKDIERACKTSERHNMFWHAFNYYYEQFAIEHIMDTYIFCLSEHDRQNKDGSLSMWRGYGCNGNGIAIVLNSANVAPIEDSPFIIAKVHYVENRDLLTQLKDMVATFATILENTTIPDDKLYIAAYNLFERIKVLSLFVKHIGFKEEKEWRIVYMKDRDPQNKLMAMIDYLVKPNGIDPKLKLKIAPLDSVLPDNISLANIVDEIILGPSVSSPISKSLIQKMLTKYELNELAHKVNVSDIPYRAR